MRKFPRKRLAMMEKSFEHFIIFVFIQDGMYTFVSMIIWGFLNINVREVFCIQLYIYIYITKHITFYKYEVGIWKLILRGKKYL